MYVNLYTSLYFYLKEGIDSMPCKKSSELELIDLDTTFRAQPIYSKALDEKSRHFRKETSRTYGLFIIFKER